ncbi:MAG: Mrp/NBP35 family ATP-binding protein [Cryomorphaceae bacterium]|nr:Mrp/NBP35 family ATP-binding protein [Cryomorphaceae bacterium]
MAVSKEEVFKALKSVVAAGTDKDITALGLVRNIQIFGEDVEVDVESPQPTLHARKKLEVDVLKAVHENINPKIKVKVRTHITEQPEQPKSNEIKGKPIPGVENIIAIASGKGGVGKSTVSANLAVELANMGFKVGLVDADIYGPSMPMMFDVPNVKPTAVDIDGKSKMQPVENYGVKMLSIGFFAGVDQAVVWRGPMASKALNQLIWDAHWGELDFLLIDLPPGTGDIHLSVVQSVPLNGAVIVSTPQNVALSDARKGVGMFRVPNINVPVLGIVENMAYFTPEELPDNKYYIFGREGAKHLAEELEVPFLGEIPLVQSIREAGDVGRPAVLQGTTVAAEAFRNVCRNMVSECVKRNESLPPTEAVRITTMAGCSAVK